MIQTENKPIFFVGLRASPSALTSLNLNGCVLPSVAVPELCRLLSHPAWQNGLRRLSLGGNKSAALGRELPTALAGKQAPPDAFTCMHTFTYTHVYVYVFMYIHIYIYIYIMYIYMHVC